eukprot:NODE_14822_length_1083_cov_5.777197.p1 GENE.NODE_14822_length_1083_cov_5.777197~~NODE_14822_length_1083_cov_5.777197.p1  ORF type:complete len:169 (-),score=60.24 NODE_14822_length_1083_cov_5.777197:502-1008(-)
MTQALVVPSDITLLEEKHSIGKRRLGLLEYTGLFSTCPMLHIHYSKNDVFDMDKVLRRKYDPDDTSAVVDILRSRQEAIRKQVVAQNGKYAGAFGVSGLVWWSFRRYNYQARLIAIPFLFYGGTFLGRIAGDVVTGRNAEYGRDRFLASLPGKVFFKSSKKGPGGEDA